jgi:geranylgeranyl diphosphate synthase type I
MDVMKYLRKRSRMIEKKVDELFPKRTKPRTLTLASRHLLGAGGKRLRPVLALVSCEAVGGKARDALKAATALELLHTFTLIHDDIMDRDDFRRNVKTVHRAWGEPMAIIAGDALFAKVFEAVAASAKQRRLSSSRTVELFETISRASFEICQGQALDIIFEGRARVKESEYMEMISRKTGALMEASTKMGALLGGGKPREVRALAKYGRLIGMAFQIQDDMLGVAGEQKKFGKPVGSDIREGKRTLIVVCALKTASRRDRAELLRALGNEDASKAEIRRAISILRKTGAIEYAARKARELVEEAKSKLHVLRDSKAKRFLLELADFTVGREL